MTTRDRIIVAANISIGVGVVLFMFAGVIGLVDGSEARRDAIALPADLMAIGIGVRLMLS